MPSSVFTKFGHKMLGIGAVALALLTAACGSTSASSTTTTGGATATTAPSCSVTSSDLSLGTGAIAPYTPTGALSGKLSIDGSSALSPLFTEAATSFDKGNGGKTTTSVTSNSSGTGLTDVSSGAVQIGESDIFASQKAGISGLTDNQVAGVIFTLVVSPDLQGKITNLTTQQVKDIFEGNDTNWSQINPAVNEPIVPVVRTTGSGTRVTFDLYVLGLPDNTTADAPANALTANKTGDLVTDVSTNNGAIGYTSTSFVLNQTQASAIFPVCIDGYGATGKNVISGNYKFWNIEHAYTKTGSANEAAGSLAQAFLAFVKSPAFQSQDLVKNGFLTLTSIPAAVLAQKQVS